MVSKLITAIVFLCIATTASAQKLSNPSIPFASLPLSGNELVGLSQSGFSKKITVENLFSAPALAAIAAANITGGLNPVKNSGSPNIVCVGNGIVDDTGCLQATINNAIRLHLPVQLGSYTYLVTPPLTVTGTVSICGNGWYLTTIKEQPGSTANVFNVGFQSTETDGVILCNFQIIGNGPHGGYGISSQFTGRQIVSGIGIIQAFCGIQDSRSNTATYQQIWGYTVGNNCQIFDWDTNPAVGRSDQLTLINLFLNAGHYGNDGFVWNGFNNTLNMLNVVMLQNNHGFWVRNTYGSTTQWAQFADIYDLQVEGSETSACQIDAGRSIYFHDSFCYNFYGQPGIGGNQGSNDSGVFIINPDSSGSVTADIKFGGGQIGGGRVQSLLINGVQGAYFTGTTFRGSSLGTNACGGANCPNVEIVSGGDIGFENDKFCGEYGDITKHPYGVQRDSGVGNVHINGGDFQYCQTGEVLDNSGAADLVVSGSIDHNGLPLPFTAGTFVSNATPTASSCGSGASLSGNNLIGQVTVGTGTVTSCTINFASSNSAKNNGISHFAGAVLTANSNVGTLSVTGTSTSMTITTSATTMAGVVINWRASQGAN